MGFLSKIFGGSGKPRTELFKAPPPPTAAAVAEGERTLNLTFPTSFTHFMSTCREMHLPLCARFYWVGTAGDPGTDDIVRANRVEHEESSSPLPGFLVAFYNDGMGNQICFDTRSRSEAGEYPVVFWDHELDSQENLEASGRSAESFERAGEVATSFPDCLRKLHERNA
jgi:SMI1-KNR4 cell-wall